MAFGEVHHRGGRATRFGTLGHHIQETTTTWWFCEQCQTMVVPKFTVFIPSNRSLLGVEHGNSLQCWNGKGANDPDRRMWSTSRPGRSKARTRPLQLCVVRDCILGHQLLWPPTHLNGVPYLRPGPRSRTRSGGRGSGRSAARTQSSFASRSRRRRGFRSGERARCTRPRPAGSGFRMARGFGLTTCSGTGTAARRKRRRSRWR